MSSFNQGVPGVPTLINSSAVLVTGNAASANALTVRQFGGGNVFSVSNAAGTVCLFVNAAGNVGVGTASPGWPLDVQTAGTRVANFQSSANGSGNIRFQCTDATTSGIGFVGVNSFANSVFGMGSSSALPVTFYQGGTEYMRIHTNGCVGIGTTNPQSNLHVTGGGVRIDNYQSLLLNAGDITTARWTMYGGSYNLAIANDNSADANFGTVAINADGGRTYYNTATFTPTGFIVAGKVGIGTASPATTLHVHDSTNGGFLELSRYTSGTTGDLTHGGIIWKGTSRSVNSAAIYSKTYNQYEDAGNLEFWASNGGAGAIFVMAVKGGDTAGTGRIGIGTTSPLFQLHVTSNIYNESIGGGFYGMNCGNMNGLIQGVYNGGSANPDGLANSDMFIGVNYNQQTGQRLAGTNHGVAQIQLVGGNASVGAIKFRCLAAGTGAVSTIPTIMTVNPTGVGIGITNPSYPLHVAGSASASSTFKYINYASVPNWTAISGTFTITLGIYAALPIGSGDSFVLFSDERIKKEEQPTRSYLEVVNSVDVKTFSYIDQVQYGPQKRVGFFAQEVEKVLPDAVTKTKDFIPNIFAKCQAEGNCVTVVNHGLTEGTKVRVFSGQSKIESNVHVIDENTIELEKTLEKEVFVFGTEVDDFRVLNYDYMSSVAFGGLKELSALVKTQAQTIQTLDARIAALEAKLNSQ